MRLESRGPPDLRILPYPALPPGQPSLHVGAILAEEDPAGWAAELAVPSPWSPNLRVIP